LKILQLIQKKQYRGAEIFCCQLSNHLVDLGHEVEVYSIYDGNAILPLSHKQIKSLSRNPEKRFLDYSGWRKIAQVIQKFKPDVVQANAADTLKYAVISKLLFRWECPIIYRNASAFSFYAKSRFSRELNSFFLKKVDKIISVSHASKRDLNQLFPSTVDKSFVIPVGIEEKKCCSHFSPVQFENALNIIHIGSFTKEKNHLGLLRIFKKVLLQIPEVGLHLLGDGPLRKEIEKKVKEMGLEKSVFFHGEIHDPFPYLKASNVLILPSIIEGLPGVILEAMHYRIPVVANNVGGISEIINKSTGTLIEKDNEEAFAIAVINELRLRNEIRIEKAFDLIGEKFLNRNISKSFIRAYNSLND
jgi:L-malate glycosyltransferase